MNRVLPILVSVALVAATIPLFAEGVAEIDFSDNVLPSEWTTPKGEWKAGSGVLEGKELQGDSHAAVLAISESHADSTIRFRFQVNGARGFHLSYNHPKGHLFRIRMTGGSAALILDKNKKDPTSKAIALQEMDFQPEAGQWYEMSCTVKGQDVKVSIGDLELEGSHPNLAREKTGFRFIVQGESVLIDDIQYSSSK